MNFLAQPVIYFIIFAGMFITVLSLHWFFTWVGLEMNMLAFILVLTKKMNLCFMEAAIKYFFTQVTVFMIFLMVIFFNNMLFG